jgi:hypothetical protein
MKKEGGAMPIRVVDSILHSSFYLLHSKGARVTTADVEQTTVAAFRPWRDS